MKPLIRAISLSDLEALRRLADIAGTEGFKFLHRPVQGVENGDVALDDPREFFLCAVANGDVIAVGDLTLRLRTDTMAGARFYESLGYRAVTSASATHVRP